jgi:hypothetical protein
MKTAAAFAVPPLFVAAVVLLIAASGLLEVACAPKAATTANTRAAARPPARNSEEKAPPLGGALDNGVVQRFDKTGRVWVALKVERAVVGQTGTGNEAARAAGLSGTVALLHEKGQPVAEMRAPRVFADDKTRAVVASGGVIVRALAQTGVPTVRADTVTWRPDADTITGRGNVVIERAPDLRMPVESFAANTRLRQIKIGPSTAPATGSL